MQQEYPEEADATGRYFIELYDKNNVSLETSRSAPSHSQKASAILLASCIPQRPPVNGSPAHCTISNDDDKTCIILFFFTFFLATCYADSKWPNGACTNCLMKHQGPMCSNSRLTPIFCDAFLTMVDECTPHRVWHYSEFSTGADRDGGISVGLKD